MYNNFFLVFFSDFPPYYIQLLPGVELERRWRWSGEKNVQQQQTGFCHRHNSQESSRRPRITITCLRVDYPKLSLILEHCSGDDDDGDGFVVEVYQIKFIGG